MRVVHDDQVGGDGTGRVALVTGASRRAGIGQAVVERLVADGFAVLVHGWEPHDAEQPWGEDPGSARALVRRLGDSTALVEADLADPAAPAVLVQAAVERFGRLDVLVANHARSSEQSLEELTAEELDLSHAVNTRGSLLLCQAFSRAFTAADGGRVVLFTSGQHHGAMPGELPYIATKGALHQLTGSLAVHLMPRGITVNCIDPGPTDTGYASPEAVAAVAARHPGGRWGTPADTARLVSWLASPESAWVTGQVIGSDGGWAAR